VPVVAAPFVEQALVSAIPRALFPHKVSKGFKFLVSRGEEHDTRVEDIWPPYIWDCSEFVGKLKEMREGPQRENICV
jgi:hypothetical protein